MTTTGSKSIRSIKIVREIDSDPDTSWIGEYSNKPGDSDKTIDRKQRGDMGRNEYRYFIAANSGEETGNPDSVEQDYQHMERIARGDVWFIGIKARAEVVVNGTIQRISSPGLWGIESESNGGYLASVAEDELSQLRVILIDLGFSEEQIDEIEVEHP